MIQGTMSNVGKSTLTLALCRYFTNKGLNVYPFKSQNISGKFIETENGKLAGAQYLQAIACKRPPEPTMNPLLIVPKEGKLQAYFLGEFIGTIYSRKYMYEEKSELFKKIIEILKELDNKHDLIIIEGAGACAEPNLKDKEIVNMRIAKAVKSPVLLISDISLGGAFAQIAGTMELLDGEEKKLIKGFIFNKFKGDTSLLEDYPQRLAQRYGIHYLGTIPYFENKLPDEDLKTTKRQEVDILKHTEEVEREIEKIANHFVSHIDIEKLEKILKEH
jgi:adenosylcobyric acid synthase